MSSPKFDTAAMKQGITNAADRAKVLGQTGLNNAKQLSQKHNDDFLNWFLPKNYTQDPEKQCICGSDIKNHMLSRVNFLKWVIVVLSISLVCLFIYVVFFSNKTEPLFDYGIGQRRYVQLDGLGSNDSYSQRMGYDKEFQPEYTQ
jgi:hypothetical protein